LDSRAFDTAWTWLVDMVFVRASEVVLMFDVIIAGAALSAFKYLSRKF
jgi:hypothetical protein